MAAATVANEGRPTVARIIERAGVGRSTFYEFFDSPEHLLEQLESRTLRSLEHALEQAFSGARTPIERVRSVCKSWLNELETRPEEGKLILTRRRQDAYLSVAGSCFRDTLQRVVEAARADGHAWLSSGKEIDILVASAAIEAASWRHVSGPAIAEPERVLTEIVTKLLR